MSISSEENSNSYNKNETIDKKPKNHGKIFKHKNKSIKKEKTNIERINEKNIIDKFKLENFYFNNYNLSYSWQDRDYITIYTKKNENNNTIDLEYNKRGKAKKK